jgi:hypothetical protein
MNQKYQIVIQASRTQRLRNATGRKNVDQKGDDDYKNLRNFNTVMKGSTVEVITDSLRINELQKYTETQEEGQTQQASQPEQ